MSYARVALDLPLDTLFDYRAPGLSARDVGCRVLVPFGRKRAVGVIIEIVDQTDLAPERVKSIIGVLRDAPPLPPSLLRLLKFCAGYYHHPLGGVVMNALPTRLREATPIRPEKPLAYRLTDAGRAEAPPSLSSRATLQRRVLELLASAETVSVAELRSVSDRAAAVVASFLERGWVVEAPSAASIESEAETPPPLTDEQEAVLQELAQSPAGFRVSLLLGVTGSGKTEVYLRLIDRVLAEGRQALVLVPEINLTPQLEARFRRRFPDRNLVSLHSSLNPSERLSNWLKAYEGAADIVLGTRLAVFTPLPRVGLIVVDEEHDASYKQQEGLRYSARDMAIVRAQQEGVPIVLGSATPALETFHNADAGRYRLLRLNRRAAAATMPRIATIDTRTQQRREGLTPPLLTAIGERLQRGEQSLVFINRRGFAPVLLCSGCGWLSSCTRCTAQMVLHLPERRLRCHHCGRDTPPPRSCPSCGNVDLLPVGEGTQRTEQALKLAFPGARVLRIDRDTTRRKNSVADLLEQVHAGEVDIVVGTQMLAKGHDFKNLTLVGVIGTDSALYSADYRASERLFAQLMQVAGRAGRAERPGEVLVQTDFPSHALFDCLQRHDYDGFARTLLTERRNYGFPPFQREALLRAEGPSIDAALDFLRRARSLVPATDGVFVYDPVPATLARLAGKERAQMLVQAASRAVLQPLLCVWMAKLRATAESRVRWSLDVDPIEF